MDGSTIYHEKKSLYSKYKWYVQLNEIALSTKIWMLTKDGDINNKPSVLF